MSACTPLRDERVIQSSNCSAMRRGAIFSVNRSGNIPAFRFPIHGILRFVQHGEKMVRHGSGSLSWTGPFVAKLSRIQLQMGLHGAVGEIGVHHGLFAIAVAHQAMEGERFLAADLFDALQHLNVDQSGHGDRRRFIRNIARFGISRDDVDLHVGLSSTLPLSYSQPLRLFSVDGGHTEAITAGDLAWAACNAIDGGIVMLDDWSNPSWPGAKSGEARHWRCGVRKLIPFAELQNKLYLTTSALFAKKYQSSLLSSPFFGQRLNLVSPRALHGRLVLQIRRKAERETSAQDLSEIWLKLVLETARINESRANPFKPLGLGVQLALRIEAAINNWQPGPKFGWVQDGLLAAIDASGYDKDRERHSQYERE